MNYKHLVAVIKLRWRMTYNQWRKAGKWNAIISIVFLVIAALAVIGGFILTLFLGNSLVGYLRPDYHLVMWMVIGGGFLFVWFISVLSELQRSELLSLDNLLHLPVSLSGAFVLNYLSSWASFSILFFLPLMLALAISLSVVFGAKMLIVGPLVFGFLVMVTGVTYQFRGWIGRIMQNKRKRGTVLACLTVGFIALSQIPQFINMSGDSKSRNTRRQARQEAVAKDAKLEASEIDAIVKRSEGLDRGEMSRLIEEFKVRRQANKEDEEYARDDDFGFVVAAVCAGIPPAWLPYGVRTASMGDVVTPILCAVGMFLVGGLSLSLAYRSTLRSYTDAGAPNANRAANFGKETETASIETNRDGTVSAGKSMLVAKTIPGTSDQTSAVAMSTIQNMLRAPESKMALAMPVVFLLIYGSLALRNGSGRSLAPMFRPLIAQGAFAVSMFALSQFAINMFGLDRNGFKAYVMMPIERWRVLLGKNLALIPIIGGMIVVLLVLLQFTMPLHFTHLIATIIMIVPTSLLFLVMGNYVSTQVPVAMSFGSMKPMQPKIGTMMIQTLFVMLTPLLVVPALAGYGLECLLVNYLKLPGIPVFLLFSIAWTAIVVWVYSKMLKVQGQFLQKREQEILAIVVSQNE